MSDEVGEDITVGADHRALLGSSQQGGSAFGRCPFGEFRKVDISESESVGEWCDGLHASQERAREYLFGAVLCQVLAECLCLENSFVADGPLVVGTRPVGPIAGMGVADDVDQVGTIVDRSRARSRS